MKTLLLCGAFLLALLVPAPGAEPSADEQAVTEAVRAMFGAFAADDAAKFHEVTAPDFYAFDGGERYKGDELIELIKKAHAGGTTFVWTITEPTAHVDGNVAWITYVNHGSIGDSSGPKKMSWLESAVLRKSDGKWRVQFLHSTRVRPADK
jgi:ketosteroid isomerase-like protein